MTADPRWPQMLDLIKRHWGIDTLRPLQEPALRAGLAGRDAMVVLPTGGGKSLCFQAPALVRPGVTVVVSPLIALMKDQVDGLRASKIAAAHIDSSLADSEKRKIVDQLKAGQLKLLYASPERLAYESFRDLLRSVNVTAFAIDEAHCISHWGHDFRPEYRQLGALKDWFPGTVVQAFTATATTRVRADVVAQLRLDNPEILVGDFDRPNLHLTAHIREKDFESQLMALLKKHRGSAGIIYVLKRRDADDWSAVLRRNGLNALGYHAGMPAEDRKRASERFKNEDVDVVVATVAFGMGIDRPDVRFVIHLGMPRSLEQYQQEAGRAGRDGLPADCVLLYRTVDISMWKGLIEKSANESEVPVDPNFIATSHEHLESMMRYCRGLGCRHRAVVEYFGQAFRPGPCESCDNCLNGVLPDPDAQLNAQKILSCVARVKESFGINHVIDVLRGSKSLKVLKFHHDKLTTHGLLKERTESTVRQWIDQLMDQHLLRQGDAGGFPVLALTDGSWDVMKGKRQATLVTQVASDEAEEAKKSEANWEGIDQGLFEVLRSLRKTTAHEQGVPPYVIFTDVTLRELARVRPSALEGMLAIPGIGSAKLERYGDLFFQALDGYCREQNPPLPRDAARGRPAPPRAVNKLTLGAKLASDHFRRGASVETVMGEMSRARSTVVGYLNDFIVVERPKSIANWVDDATYARIAAAAKADASGFLKPIFDALKEEVPYDTIRLVVTHLNLASPVA